MQMIGVVTLISKDGADLKPVDEFMRMGDVVFLSWTANQPDRIAERVAGRVDLRTQPAT